MGLRTLQPRGFAPPKGYANGMAGRGTIVVVGGQIGWNERQQFESDEFVAQVPRPQSAPEDQVGVRGDGGGGVDLQEREPADRVEHPGRALPIEHLRLNGDAPRLLPGQLVHHAPDDR